VRILLSLAVLSIILSILYDLGIVQIESSMKYRRDSWRHDWIVEE